MSIVKKIFSLVFALTIIISLPSFADNEINVKIDNKDKSLLVDGRLTAENSADLLGMLVKNINGKLINISDCETDKTGKFEFEKIILKSNSGFEVLDIIIDTGEKLENRSAIVAFEDYVGTEKIENFSLAVSKLSNEQINLYYEDFLKFVGFDITKSLSYKKLKKDGFSFSLAEKLKSEVSGICTKSEYITLINKHLFLTDIEKMDIASLKQCLTDEFQILSNSKFNSASYLKLTKYEQDLVFENVMSKLYKSEDEFYNAINSEINILNETESTSGNTSSSSGGISSGGGKIKYPIETKNIEEKTSFDDISNYWGKKDIEYLFSKKIISGYPDNTFRPSDFVTRAEAACVIQSAFGVEQTKEKGTFKDVLENDWFYSYINNLYASKIMNGDENYFYPNNEITRQDLCTIIYRCLKTPATNYKISFEDNENISQYANNAISYLSEKQIVQGNENMFLPQKSITRGEMCAIICRVMQTNK